MTSPLTTEARNHAMIDWVGVLRTLKQEARGFFTHIEDPAAGNPRAAAYVAEVLVREGKIVKWPTGFAGGIHTHENPPDFRETYEAGSLYVFYPRGAPAPYEAQAPVKPYSIANMHNWMKVSHPLREAAGGRPFITVLPEGVGNHAVLSQVSDVLIVGGKIVKSRWPGMGGHAIGREWTRHDEHVYGELCSPYYFYPMGAPVVFPKEGVE